MTKEHKPDEKYFKDWESARRNKLWDVNPHAKKLIIYGFYTVISLRYPTIRDFRQTIISFSLFTTTWLFATLKNHYITLADSQNLFNYNYIHISWRSKNNVLHMVLQYSATLKSPEKKKLADSPTNDMSRKSHFTVWNIKCAI
jgi:hypothetical protein